MDFVDILSSDSGDVKPVDMDLGVWLRLIGLGLDREVKMPDGRRTSGPDSAKQALLFAVNAAESRRSSVSSEQSQRFLVTPSVSRTPGAVKAQSIKLTSHALSARWQ